MRPEPLIFPVGVRFPEEGEWPKGYEEELRRLKSATITTGYVHHDYGGDGFTAYFEANVHAPKLFAVFRSLAVALLPGIVPPVIGLKGEEPLFGHYTDRDAGLAVLEPYWYELANDGFLEFGLMFQTEGRTEEVFVHQTKYFKIWTSKPDVVRGVLEKHGIPEEKDLQFIENYPRISETLEREDGQTSWEYVFNNLTKAIKALPER